ncbi:uncharacterized protein LOC128193080 [Crassostrea angulata]|uniref:uncharacterized protein LOC128193080 n=1 Tax=Magallana angulata TaxID=2784310 RepID=UPI0022B177D8|nr:uncharacterized protein LOC128193080 [Crassostrea angulata]
MWRFKAFCNSKKDNSLADKKKASCCRDGLPFTEEWDRLISKGVSPKEIWETRYEEVNRINSDFTHKLEFSCENGPKKSMTPSLASAVEHLLLIFGKGYVQEMQGRWEKAQEFGMSSVEFWDQEASKFEKKHWWWRWMGKKSDGKKEVKRSEFDEETLKD